MPMGMPSMPGGMGTPGGGNMFARQARTGARSRYVDTLNPNAMDSTPVGLRVLLPCLLPVPRAACDTTFPRHPCCIRRASVRSRSSPLLGSCLLLTPFPPSRVVRERSVRLASQC